MARTQENKDFARRWNEEIWGRQNLDAVDDLVAEDFVGHDPSRPAPVRGPEGVREVVETLFSAFPDTQVDLEEVVAEGDMIAMRITASGTHEGEFVGIEPTGERMEAGVMTFQRIEDGKAVEEWQIVDMLGMLRQLGVTELPGGRADRTTGT